MAFIPSFLIFILALASASSSLANGDTISDEFGIPLVVDSEAPSEVAQPRFEGSSRDPLWDAKELEQFKIIHVKIFPHHSKYNAPQSRDTIMQRFRMRSESKCTLYPATNDTSKSEPLRDRPIASAKAFAFDAKNFRNSAWLECAGSAQLIREEYQGRPIRYNGRFFIKKITPAAPALPYLTVVNVLPFEEYLRGVVPSEMPASWSQNSLRAQAVAARTYAYYELLSRKALEDENLRFEDSGAQLDDTVSYQAYLGLNMAHPNSDAAILATAGKVMTYNGRIIKAFFHADSGGHTEDAVNVWGEDHPYIRARPEVYPAGSIPGSDWVFTTPLASIQEDLRRRKLIAADAVLRSVSVNDSDRYPSGRAQWVNLQLAGSGQGVQMRVAGVDFAYALGLKSNWIWLNIARGSSSVRITGKGYGHGAGMNQWGAKVMIEKMNYSFEDTLKFYYSGIEFSQL